jgi:HK97 family phage major capsid protein
LAALYFGHAGAHTETPSMTIVLRKVRGLKGLTPLFRSKGGSFGSGIGPSAVGNFLFSPLVLVAIAIAFGIAWIAAHGGWHPTGATGLAAFALFPIGRTAVEEADAKLAEKSKHMHEVFEKAGDSLDFEHKDVLALTGKKNSGEVVEYMNSLNAELEDLGKKRDQLVKLANIREENQKRLSTPANPLPQPTGRDDDGNPEGKGRLKQLGHVILNSLAFKDAHKNRGSFSSVESGFGLAELKAVFSTAAGIAPESLRTGLMIEKATRPIQLLDIIPSLTTDMAQVKYMEETTRTQNEAERAEAAAYAEDAFVWTERAETVRSIGGSIPVTDEQLEDVAGVEGLLNQRLVFGCRQRLDGQVIIGDGNAPNLTGIKNKAGINTQAKGADPIPDAVYKAARVVRVTGRAFPNAVVFHPTDWEKVRLLRNAQGDYIWGSPAIPGPETIWGLQVVQCDADAAGSAYVADYANFCALYERRGIEVAVGYVNADFLNGKRTIRAGLRVAFAIYRAAAFTQVTGL